MRRWLDRWVAGARHAADRPELWLPGALAWTVGAGWIPLVVAVARPPSDADLAFFGAGIFTSGAWPWNAILISAAAVLLVVLAISLASVGEAALLARLVDRRPRAGDATRVLGIQLVTAGPALALMLLTAVALVIVAPAEFRSADEGGAGPFIAALVRVSPLLIAIAVTLVLGTAYAAAATRLVIDGRADLPGALAAAPRRLVGAGGAVLAQALATWVVRVGYLVLTGLLLAVLWAPIGARLSESGTAIDIGVGLLLVGFVAIWLCLVLGGGAVHAWGSATWSGLLGQRGAMDREEAADRP